MLKNKVQLERTLRIQLSFSCVLCFGALLSLAGCPSSDTPVSEIPSDVVVGPDWPIDTPKSVGIDGIQLDNAVENWQDGNLHALVVALHGKLVYEEYRSGVSHRFYADEVDEIAVNYGPSTPHYLFSVTKGVSSILMGIAIDEGYVADVDEPASKYLPQYQHLFADKTQLSIRNLLDMRSGIQWYESADDNTTSNFRIQMNLSSDWAQFVLSQPLDTAPGSNFSYNTGNSYLLSPVFLNAIGENAFEFAREKLFAPLGITDYEWMMSPQGLPLTGGSDGGLYLSARDLAKIGQVILDDGRWAGQQIVSPAWIDTIRHPVPADYGYSLSFFHDRLKIAGSMHEATWVPGLHGQMLIVLHDLSTVVVIFQDTLGGYPAATSVMLDAVVRSIES